jgi:hypothetical protein
MGKLLEIVVVLEGVANEPPVQNWRTSEYVVEVAPTTGTLK